MTTESASPASGADAANPRVELLRAKEITKRFGGLVAVKDADLVIPEGSIVALIGPNGAGKTTFFNIIAGILDPSEGEILFRGRKMIARRSECRFRPQQLRTQSTAPM